MGAANPPVREMGLGFLWSGCGHHGAASGQELLVTSDPSRDVNFIDLMDGDEMLLSEA